MSFLCNIVNTSPPSVSITPPLFAFFDDSVALYLSLNFGFDLSYPYPRSLFSLDSFRRQFLVVVEYNPRPKKITFEVRNNLMLESEFIF